MHHAFKHGHWVGGKATKTYTTWLAMKSRCYQPKNTRYKDYGARGIKVCQRWLDSFQNFLDDMGEAPIGKSIDRFPDNDGDYEPGNCRWSDAKSQARNRRSSKLDDEKVRAIRESAEAGKALAAKFGVCQSVISQIRSGKLWA